MRQNVHKVCVLFPEFAYIVWLTRLCHPFESRFESCGRFRQLQISGGCFWQSCLTFRRASQFVRAQQVRSYYRLTTSPNSTLNGITGPQFGSKRRQPSGKARPAKPDRWFDPAPPLQTLWAEITSPTKKENHPRE